MLMLQQLQQLQQQLLVLLPSLQEMRHVLCGRRVRKTTEGAISTYMKKITEGTVINTIAAAGALACV